MAMERAWTPSCCLVCSAWRVALSAATSASTRLPMPWVRVLDRLEVKLSAVVTWLASVPSLETARLTLLMEVLMEVRRLEDWLAVVKVEPAVMVRLEPPKASDWARIPGVR